LKSVAIPSSVTKIENETFSNCLSLETVNIPSDSRMISIGAKAFYNCNNLLTFTIPPNVSSMGSRAFYSCTSLTTFTIPPNSKLTIIPEYAFFNSGLPSVRIPSTVTSIEGNSFAHGLNLKSFDVDPDNSVYASVDGLLVNRSSNTLVCYPCGKGTPIQIPSIISTIGCFAFSYCSALTSVSIPTNIETIESGAFTYCTNLTSVTIPSSVSKIGTSAFGGCKSLSSVSFSPNVTTIEELTFSGCTSLVSISIPNGVKEISHGAFSGCTSLVSVILPLSLTYIGFSAFDSCRRLSHIVASSSAVFEQCCFSDCGELKLSIAFLGVDWVPLPFDCEKSQRHEVYCTTSYGRTYLTYEKLCVPVDSSRHGMCYFRSDHCEDLIISSNECYVAANIDDMMMRPEIVSWNERSDSCVDFSCDNSTGQFSRRRCNDSSVCLNGTCVSRQDFDLAIASFFRVEIEIDLTLCTTAEIYAFFSQYVVQHTSEMLISTETTEDGHVYRITVLVNDHDTAQTVFDAAQSCAKERMS